MSSPDLQIRPIEKDEISQFYQLLQLIGWSRTQQDYEDWYMLYPESVWGAFVGKGQLISKCNSYA